MEIEVVAICLAVAAISTTLLIWSAKRNMRLRNIKRLKESAFARDIKLMIRREHDDKITEKNRGVTPNA